MTAPAREQTRARYPDAAGHVERGGVRVFWERYGEGAPAFLLLPTWEIVHSRSWKAQIPYLARHGTVVTFDPRGNGRSDRPSDPAAYDRREYAEDAVSVLAAAGVDRALVVAWCDLGESLILAAEHPGLVQGLIEIAPAFQVGRVTPEPVAYPFDEPLDTDEGWARENRHYWLRDWPAMRSSSSASASPSRTRPSRSRMPSAGRSRPIPTRCCGASTAGTGR